MVMWLKSCFLIYISLFFCNCSYFYENNITNKFEYFEDVTHNVEITNIESVPEWNPFRVNTMNFQYTKSVIWLRAKTSNETFKPGSILSFEWRVLDNIKLYFPNSNHSYTEFKTGDSYPKVSWAVPEGLNPGFRIPFHSAEKYFYIRLQSSSLISFPILLLNEKEFQNKTILETSINWSLICICAIMFIISLFYALAFRMYAFLYYSIYVITHTLWYNTQYGNSFHSFWPYATWWQSKAILFFLSIGVATSFQFTRLFLQTKIKTPIADRILFLFALLGCFLAVAILFSDEYALLFKVIQLTYIVSIPFILLTGIRVYILGDKKIVFFLLSWGLYFVFGYISIFYYLGISKYSLLAAYGPVFAFPIDFFFLLFNLFQKYQDLTLSRNNISERMFKLESQLSNRYTKSKLENIDYNHYIQKLELWMKESKPYLDEMMDLEKTAKAIGLNVQQTSELINAKLGQSFRSYVNSYRIDEAKRLLKYNPELTILSIAFTTGFGSKSSFNSEFKKTLGITPLEFRKKIQLD
ncbi:7TM diverse intracellular signaling domain-containing protein [Leptospira montravelensis]|uniref:7TM diverse intracellular signaling domain-containing protein n=2 Tax=Leptospira montravelensis TaxID=2484961 RepID=UPI0023EB0CDC|nr:7TM diverse intracellular signaling domain-containing protein [Leptospira montravelensis]